MMRLPPFTYLAPVSAADAVKVPAGTAVSAALALDDGGARNGARLRAWRFGGAGNHAKIVVFGI